MRVLKGRKSFSLVLAVFMLVLTFTATLSSLPAMAVNANVHGGNISVRVDTIAINRADIYMEAGKSYNFSFWLKAPAGYKISVMLGLLNTSSGDYTDLAQHDVTIHQNLDSEGYSSDYIAADNDWHEYTAVYTPQTTNTYYVGVDCRPQTGDWSAEHQYYIDDVKLYEAGQIKNMIPDGDFETAEQAHRVGTSGNGWPEANLINQRWISIHSYYVHAYGNPASPPALVITGEHDTHIGNAGIAVDKNGISIVRRDVSLKADTNYTFSFWLKGVAGAKIGGMLRTGDPATATETGEFDINLNHNYHTPYTLSDTKWHKYTIQISSLETGGMYNLGIDYRASSGDYYYVDNIELYEAGSAVNLLPDGNFEHATQGHHNNNGTDWMTANWIDDLWYCSIAHAVHQYGTPDGSKALNIAGTPAPVPDNSRLLDPTEQDEFGFNQLGYAIRTKLISANDKLYQGLRIGYQLDFKRGNNDIIVINGAEFVLAGWGTMLTANSGYASSEYMIVENDGLNGLKNVPSTVDYAVSEPNGEGKVTTSFAVLVNNVSKGAVQTQIYSRQYIKCIVNEEYRYFYGPVESASVNNVWNVFQKNPEKVPVEGESDGWYTAE